MPIQRVEPFMSLALITGAAGLVGAAASHHFHDLGYDVWGIDNDGRRDYFGDEATTAWMRGRLEETLTRYHHHDIDVRDREGVARVVAAAGQELSLVIHAAAQPSHDWSAGDPVTDFHVNAVGTVNLLEAVRQTAPGATFVFVSTNKVYGDTPNRLPLEDLGPRLDLPAHHEWHEGVPETMSLDESTHSPFGVSKAAADLMVQEYGRYFGLATGVFRGGCLTGPGHSGAQLHGFLAYLMKCTVTGAKYTVYGYEGKQVRDNLHAADLVSAFEQFANSPRPARVYNIGGGRTANCSMLEAIEMCETIAGRELDWEYSDRSRIGDHRWWISDTARFRRDYPDWQMSYDIPSILEDIHDQNRERWISET